MLKRITAILLAALLLAACEGGAAKEPTNAGTAGAGKKDKKSCPTDTTPKIDELALTKLAGGDAPTTINVDAGTVLGKIDRAVYGVNHRYPYNGFGTWDPDAREVVPEFVDKFDYAGFGSIRFPGGRTANNYHWERAIGPVEDRVGHVDSAFGRTTIYGQVLTNEFGPDEFGKMLEATGAIGSIVANFATSNADETANWVEYMNAEAGTNPRGGVAWADKRAENGHPEPYGVKYWEIGNELAGEKTFWLGEDATELERAPKYIFGGETPFEKQLVSRQLNFSPSASVSTGKPNEEFYVLFPPVKPGSQTVYVGDEVWKETPDLKTAGKKNVYGFEPKLGKITFGDGTNGNIPPKGKTITITHISGPHDGFNDFYREMKEADPTIEVGSALNSPLFMEAMGTEYPYDFLVGHSYSYFFDTPNGNDELHDLMMTMPDVQAGKVQDVKDQIVRYAGPELAKEVQVVITEWAMATGLKIGLGRINAPKPYTQSLDGALYVALMLNKWIELGVPLAEKHTLVDINPAKPPRGYTKIRTAYQSMIGAAPCFIMTTKGHAFHLYTSLMGTEHIPAEVANNPTRQIFNGASLESLEVIASRNEAGDVTVIVTNTERENSVKAKLITSGFEGSGEVSVSELNGPTFLAYNTVERPNLVHLSEATITNAAKDFVYEFPAHSITAFVLHSR